MTVIESIGKGFKELLKESSYNKVTVSDICTRAGVSRKTFYANYSDKQDVVERLFYNEILKPLMDLQDLLPIRTLKSAPLLLYERLYQSIYDDRIYYENLIKDNGHHNFVEIVTAQITTMNLAILKDYKLAQVEREHMAYFFAAAQAMLMVKWIKDKMTLTPHQMAVFFNKWTTRSWEAVFPGKREF